MNRIFLYAVIALIIALAGTVSYYHWQLTKVTEERNLYQGQLLASQDSVRTLAVYADSLEVAARLGFPGEDAIDDALNDVPGLPDDFPLEEIESLTSFTYLPPADSAKGESVGPRTERGFLHDFSIGIRTHNVTFRGFVRQDTLEYAMWFNPKPQRIHVMTRPNGPVLEHIVVAPGLIVDLDAFDRRPVPQELPRRILNLRARGFAVLTPAHVITGLEVGPVWKWWKLDVSGGVGMYSVGGTQQTGVFTSATFTL